MIKLTFSLLLAILCASCTHVQHRKTTLKHNVRYEKRYTQPHFSNMVNRSTLDDAIDAINVSTPINIAVVLPDSDFLSEAEIQFIISEFSANQNSANQMEGFSDHKSSGLNIKYFNTMPINEHGLVNEDLLLFNPSIIIGPIKSVDTSSLAEAAKNSNLDVKIISLSNNIQIADGKVIIFGFSAQDAIKDTLTSISDAKESIANYGILLANDRSGSNMYSVVKTIISENNGFVMRSEFYDVGQITPMRKYVLRLKNDTTKEYLYDKSGNLLNKQKMKAMKIVPDYTSEIKEMDALFISDTQDIQQVLDVLSVESFPKRILTMPDFALSGIVVPENICLSFTANEQEFALLAKYSENGVIPSRFGLVLYDAIGFAIHALNHAEGFSDSNFIGVNGETTIEHNIVKRKQSIGTFKKGVFRSDENLSLQEKQHICDVMP